MRRRDFLAAGGALFLAGCTTRSATPALSTGSSPTPPPSTAPSPVASPTSSAPPTEGTVAEILARSNVPVLCFHQLREFRADDSAYARTLITPPDVFRNQLLAIRDGGWTPVSAPDLIDHLRFGTPLPERALLLSFDDGSATHATVALPVLAELGFPAVFFPMTVVLDKPDWLSRDQLRELERAGMTIGAHTWDHQRLDRISGDQWPQQLDQPAADLAEILGHPVDLMAYPYGVWSPETLAHVAAAGYRAAFQLADATDPDYPMLTIRRVMPPPTWDGPALLGHLDADF
ncbi:polysaccharide deacetylase family protein [Modestobacter sp. DSM 44400]|uniref:polysaccharide deacetylase family protein n=1 Tax=Modestobacter sp. DSM 44400 TaxID=1550230 RepID=UPI000B8425F4|nr:polysaccharide deacetylase family protein [Modestobacter sp. DSM 44400]